MIFFRYNIKKNRDQNYYYIYEYSELAQFQTFELIKLPDKIIFGCKMTLNDFYVRKLTLKDMPRIKNISSGIWEGHDYIPAVIEDWISRVDCYVFGIIDKASEELLAFSNVRWLLRNEEKIAWMEGGRVDFRRQKRGYGTELSKYALKYAKDNGAVAAMYDTSSRNLGTKKIGKNYDFKMKFCMHHLFIEPKNFNIETFSPSGQIKVREIEVLEAFRICKNIPNGPIEEFSKGWSYIPLDYDNLKKIKGKWFTNNRSILLVLSLETEIWLITYGEINYSLNLISNFLHKHDLSHCNTLEVFCHPEIGPFLNELGFKYSNKEELENKPAGVLLFEKLF